MLSLGLDSSAAPRQPMAAMAQSAAHSYCALPPFCHLCRMKAAYDVAAAFETWSETLINSHVAFIVNMLSLSQFVAVARQTKGCLSIRTRCLINFYMSLLLY